MKLRYSIILFTFSLFISCSSGSSSSDGNIPGDGSTLSGLPKLVTSDTISSIPKPPAGKRWVLNAEYSDEFNGTELDETKWQNYNESWIGRAPGLFCPEQVSVRDGYLQLKGEKMEKPVIKSGATFTIKCAAVVSKEMKASYGYYECKMKANKTPLSSTFWLNTRGWRGNFDTNGVQPSDCPEGTFSQELDIHECVGRVCGKGTENFIKGMNSNYHFKIVRKSNNQKTVTNWPINIKQTNDKNCSDDFHIYGCWWRSDSYASFYLNNKNTVTQKFQSKEGINFLFPKSMALNMVTETYDWVDLPTDEELADPNKNTTLYDWVRSYYLVDFSSEGPEVDYKGIFSNHIHLNLKPSSGKFANSEAKIKIDCSYTAPSDSYIIIQFIGKENRLIKESKYIARAGYGRLSTDLKIDGIKPDVYMLKATLQNTKESNSIKYESDSFYIEFDKI